MMNRIPAAGSYSGDRAKHEYGWSNPNKVTLMISRVHGTLALTQDVAPALQLTHRVSIDNANRPYTNRNRRS